jgi:hypothetical protein
MDLWERVIPTLQHSLDRIHSRYGSRGVARGSQLVALTSRGAL